MTITVFRDALLPALTMVGKALERRTTIPILANLKLEAAGDELFVTGSDLDSEMCATVPCRADAPVALTLPGALLRDAVRKLPDKAEVAIRVEDQAATVASGRSRFRLQTLPAADFPSMDAGTFTHRFTLKASALSSVFATVGFAVSSEETRYYLNGIHLHEAGENLVAVATDGHRLARMTVPMPEGGAGMPAIIVPRRAIALMRDMVGDEGDVDIELSDRKIRVSAGGVAMVSKLIDGTFPDYQRVIPAGNPNAFTVDRQSLAHAIDRVVTIGAERGSAVRFAFSAEAVALSLTSADNGAANDEVAASGSADPVEIGFNGRYCLDVLNAAAARAVRFELGDAGTPALVRPEGSESVLFVLMPMRIGLDAKAGAA